jgi:hypothetical protein
MILPYTMICFRKELGVLTDYSKTPENAWLSSDKELIKTNYCKLTVSGV